MSRKSLAFVLVVVALCSLLIGGCEPPAPPEAPKPTQAEDAFGEAALPPRPMRKEGPGREYKGVVSAVGQDWFELAVGWRVSTRGPSLPPDPAKPKRISAARTKLAGDSTGESWTFTHLISDLQVGDRVHLDTCGDWDDESEFVYRLQIKRRPGGVIPPITGDFFPGTENALQLRDQAEQDWEERRVPIPRKYLDENGQAPWTNPPYMPLPVAPPPRAVTPAAKP